ncbi:MAG: dihydrodipicolinate reductase [Mycobacterium sp.]
MTYRVVQWSTGNVGRLALRAIIEHPDLELVGVHASNPDKIGKDAAELCGLDTPIGVTATNDVDTLLDLKPDVICYNTQARSLDELCKILAAGVNVVGTSRFITGRRISADAAVRLDEACQRGGSSLYGSGVNPGHVNVIALLATGFCDRLHSLSFTESVDVTDYGSIETWEVVGWGKPPSAGTDMTALIEQGTTEAAEGIEAMADALGVELDEICFENMFSVAQEDLELPHFTLPAGTVAGMRLTYHGMAYGRRVITVHMVYRVRGHVEPPLDVLDGYQIEIQGEPSLKMTLEFDDTRVPDVNRDNTFMGSALVAAAAAMINAIPAVCDARPGIRIAAELPPIVARHLVFTQ